MINNTFPQLQLYVLKESSMAAKKKTYHEQIKAVVRFVHVSIQSSSFGRGWEAFRHQLVGLAA